MDIGASTSESLTECALHSPAPADRLSAARWSYGIPAHLLLLLPSVSLLVVVVDGSLVVDASAPGCLVAWLPGCLVAWLTGCPPASSSHDFHLHR